MRSIIRKRIFIIGFVMVILLTGYKLMNIQAKDSLIEYQSILIEEGDQLNTIINRYYEDSPQKELMKDAIIKINHLEDQGNFITAGDYLIIPIVP